MCYQKHIKICQQTKKSPFMAFNFWNFGERNQQEPIPKNKNKEGRKSHIILGEVFLKQEELKPKTNLMNILKEKRNKILFFLKIWKKWLN